MVKRLLNGLVCASTVLTVSCTQTATTRAPSDATGTQQSSSVVAIDTASVVGKAPTAGAIVIPMPESAARPEALANASVVMDQRAQMFLPSILIARTGQPVLFTNSDEELHNINVKDDTRRQRTERHPQAIPAVDRNDRDREINQRRLVELVADAVVEMVSDVVVRQPQRFGPLEGDPFSRRAP
jgi:plastocyanin